MKLLLIPCAPSEWHASGRLLGRAELAPSGSGADYCGAILGGLTERPARLLHGPDELSSQSARWLARECAVGARLNTNLAEVDLGLWTGLTLDQFRARFASACRQLEEDPTALTPPEGENLADAGERLRQCILRVMRREERLVGLTLRPLALALLQRLLGADDALPELMWSTAPRRVEIDRDAFAALPLERSIRPDGAPECSHG